MTRISGTVIALNEERKIARALESMRCCDEIVVVDSGSTDRTRDVARRLGARVVEQPWLGYAAQKNRAAECAAHRWILSLDADEAISENLEAEVLTLKESDVSLAGYDMPRVAQYLGRWIRHSGWYPDRKIRLYDRERASWTGDLVHESVQVNGATGHLEGNLLHFTCDSLSEHLRTLDRYTSLAAEELRTQGREHLVLHMIFDPPWTFFRTFLLRRGFLDGVPGFTIAWMAALYTFLKYAKAR